MTGTPALKTVACLMIAGLMLGGCGLRGKLETAPPMWGDDSRASGDAPVDQTSPEDIPDPLDDDLDGTPG